MPDSHDDEPVLKPSEFLAYRRANGLLPEFLPPEAVIFAPQKSLADYALRHYASNRIKGFAGEFHLLKRTNSRIALATGFGIGSPVIAALADEFSVLGVQKFALIGLAGSLQPELTAGNLVVSEGAIRGEGVSRHYLPPQPIVNSSQNLVNHLSAALSAQNWPYARGITWTTDAPFRELRKDVLAHQWQGVLAVDMEAAALLAVAKSMNLDAIAAFSIADQLSNGHWKMTDDMRPAQRGLTILLDAMIQSLLQNK